MHVLSTQERGQSHTIQLITLQKMWHAKGQKQIRKNAKTLFYSNKTHKMNVYTHTTDDIQ